MNYRMLPVRRITGVVAVLALALGAARPVVAQRYVAGPDTLHPRLEFPDSLMSANDRCMVSRAKLNPK
jgi:hypothetical protein